MAQGRPPAIELDDIIVLNAEEATTLLQEDTDRKAIIKKLIDFGGRATATEINTAFGFDVRVRLRALEYTGWIEVIPAATWTGTMPRRPKTLGLTEANS